MKKYDFPENTQSAVYIDKLIISKDKRLLSERMSSRMVRSASVMDKGDHVGWQMFVPTKGLVKMSVFGSAGVGTDDLTWIVEKTGRTSKSNVPRMAFDNLTELYEIYLPIAERKTCSSSIGFHNTSPSFGFKNEADTDTEGISSLNTWPAQYSPDFRELIRVLRITGAFLRVVIGPAAPDEQNACIKNMKRTYSGRIPFSDYAGHPVKMRVLLRLPGAACSDKTEKDVSSKAASVSIRLKTIIEESVSGAKLRFIGSMDALKAQTCWNSPLKSGMSEAIRSSALTSGMSEAIRDSALKSGVTETFRTSALKTEDTDTLTYAATPVLPDYAARILMMEPEIAEPVIGIEICEEEAKKYPASHKNVKDSRAVTIGKATDTSGIKRKITIGQRDLVRHYQIVGQTGTGKSTLLTTIILSAIERGHGLTFFDPHGSTIDMIIRALPEKHVNRVRVVRIGDIRNPVPLNIWDSDDPLKEERNINDLCELFADIFDPKGEGIVGPRYERWLSTFAKASIAFLGRRASLESIAVISQSQDNMLKLYKIIYRDYPELAETIRQEYGTDRSSDFQNMLNWYLCKFQRLTAVEQLRLTLGAGANALDMNRTIDTDTVTLIDLASPAIGTHAARIVGTLQLMKLWNAAMARHDRDRMHLVVIDEASLFQTNPMPRMLAESRKFGISMILCHQHTGQLTAQIRDALEANSANFSAFRLSPRDAATAGLRFDDPTVGSQLTRLDAFNAVTTLSVDGRQTAPFTLETERPRKVKNAETIADRIMRRSIETLVDPYKGLRALTPEEIQYMLNEGAARWKKAAS